MYLKKMILNVTLPKIDVEIYLKKYRAPEKTFLEKSTIRKGYEKK